MIDRLGKEINFSELFMEETLSAKDKKEIPDSMYGLVYTDEIGNKVRKFPLNDESHVRQAAIFFDRAKGLSDDQKRELARNIVRRAKELDMDYSGWESLKPYLGKSVKESFMTYEWLMKQNYPDPDSTSGTSDFDDSDNEPDDCYTESFEEMFGSVIQEAFDAITGEEIPINHAYTMEEMAKRSLSLDEAKAIEKDELIPIKPPKTDEVYFGSPTNHMPEIDLNRPLFVSPYKGIASIFIWGDMGLQDRIPRGSYNHNYEEWINFDEKKMKNPLKEVHVYVEGAPFLEPFTVEQEGYIHCISTKDYLNNFFRKPWMTKDLEYLITKTDNMKVELTRSIKCKVKYYIKGRPSPKGKSYGPSKSGVLQYIHKIAKSIHAKYKADQKEPTGNQNCLLCSWCAEAQMRGQDYLPRPIYSPRDSALEIEPESMITGIKRVNLKGGYQNLLSHLKSAKEPFARWYCHVKWGHGNGGHEFLIVKIDDNSFGIMDAQQGTFKPLNADDYHVKDIDWNESYICRIDDKPFKYMKLDQINDPKKTLPWDPKKDIPYMVKHGMSTKEEAEKELKKTETNLFTSELKKALGQTHIQESALPDGVFLRPATLKDVPTMRDWQLESINARLRKRPDMVEYMEKDARENVPDTKMIMSGDRTIGMLQCCWIDDGEWWYIGEIYLIAEFRGRGIGSTLLLNEIREHDKLRLQVATDNPHVKALYESLGFKTVRMNQDMEVMDLVKTPESVCENMIEQLKSFKYGLGYDGSIHHGSSKDFDEKYRLESPEEFEKNGGGICYDYVEWQAGYLEAYGYTCRKFFISTDTKDMDTHTFILVDDGNGKFIYPEAAFKLLEGTHTVKFLDEAIDMIMKKVWDINDNKSKYDKIKYYIWEYKDHPPYGSDMKTCHEYFTKGEPIGEGMIKNPYK